MKKILFSLLFVSAFSVNGQTDEDFARIYIKRAIEAIEVSIDYETALTNFEKAMKYKDTILDKKVASLGSLIYFETHHKQPTDDLQLEFLEKSRDYSAQYFNLTKNKSSEEYMNNMENRVMIRETLLTLESKIRKSELERLQKEKELRKIDSLKQIWKTTSDALSIKADSVYKFNKNGFAVFQKKGFYGVITDLGGILVEANEYKDFLSFDGYIILKNQKVNPTRLYAFDTKSKLGFALPNISDFNPLSTHFGEIMLPRGNGRVVAYPNNSQKVLVYDLISRKFVRVANEVELLKNLKKSDVIDKYKKEGTVRVDKNWYTFGGHLGGGIHPMYSEEGYRLEGFLCSIDGKFLNATSSFQSIGVFYNGKFEAMKSGERVWINQNGTEVSKALDQAATYTGKSILTKLENGSYQIVRDNVIILGDKKLEKITDYLKKFGE
jgi:hypothetical protein